MNQPSVLTLRDWELSRKLGVGDVPKTAEEVFEEKVGVWHKGLNGSRFRRLASNIFEGRTLEKNDSNDRASLRDAENVLQSFNTVATPARTAVDPPKGRENISDAISVADMKKLKVSRLLAAKQAADAARAAVEAEAAKLRPRPPQPVLDDERLILFEDGRSSPEKSAMANVSRPRSAPGLRRSLDLHGSGNVLNAVRRHNAARLQLDSSTPFTAFTNLPAAPTEGQTSSNSIALQALASRTQEERFGHVQGHQQNQESVKDDALGGPLYHGEGDPQSLAHSHPTEMANKKTVNIAKFGKKQDDWRETVQSKRDDLKRELDNAQMRELRDAPNVKLTSDSWERAKKEHALQAERQAKVEEKQLEFKLLKQELKNQSLKEEILKKKSATGSKRGEVLRREPDGDVPVIKAKRRVKRRSSAVTSNAGDDPDQNNYMRMGRHDPDSLCLPFDVMNEEGGLAVDLSRHQHHRRAVTAGGSMMSSTPRGSKAPPHAPALPNLDSLDLLSGKVDHDIAHHGNKTARTRPSSLRRENVSGWDASTGAMAALGGDLILHDKKQGADSDRLWLEGVMRQRKDDQLKKEAQFELELAAMMGDAMVVQELETFKKKTSLTGMAAKHSTAPALHEAKRSGSESLSLQSQQHLSSANDSEDDFLYVSDTDDDSIAAAPKPGKNLETEPSISTSDKLDALITDLNDLRGTLETRISSVTMPLIGPSALDVPRGSALLMTGFTTTATTKDQTTLPAAFNPAPTTISAANITNVQTLPVTACASSQARQALSLEIPATAFLAANGGKQKSQGTTSGYEKVVPNRASSILREENSLLTLTGVDIKNDPLTEALLTRASSADASKSFRPLQRPRTTQLQSHEEVREHQERQRRDRELVTSLTRFFDSSSTADKGRFRLHDAREFVAESMFRKQDILNDSVTLLCGTRKDNGLQQIITVLFDRTEFSEAKAREWWLDNRDRLLF